MKSSRSFAVANVEGEISSTTPREMVVMTRTSPSSARIVTLSPSSVGRTRKPVSVIEDLPYIFASAGVLNKPVDGVLNPSVSLLFPRIFGGGGARRNRTDDLFNAIEALSQLSYGPIFQNVPAPIGAEPPSLPRAAV